MTEDEALERFDNLMLGTAGDQEFQHSAADMLLLEALRSLGWNRLVDKWTNAAEDWWWA